MSILRRSLQKGFTAIELLVVLIVVTVALGMGSDALNNYTDRQVELSATDHANLVADAAARYVKDYNGALLAVATPSTPAVVTVAMLQATGALQAQVNPINPYGQSYSILVLQPSAGKLQTLIVTTGGEVISELGIRRIAQTMGARGGYISSASSTVATGAYSSWSMPLASYGVSPGPGHLAVGLFVQDEGLVSDFVYRNAVAGHPELNSMNTPLIMNSVQTAGNACTTNGAIAVGATGEVLSCQSLTWQQQGSAYWKDPVALASSLPACNASTAWQTRVVLTPTVGSGPRAYTCTSGVWQPLAVNDAGQLTVPSTLTVGGNATIAGNATISGNAQVNGTLGANGRITAGEYIQYNGVAVENNACPSNGLVGRDAVGLLLSCQSGLWKKAGGNGQTVDPSTGYTIGFCTPNGIYGTRPLVTMKRVGGLLYAFNSAAPAWYYCGAPGCSGTFGLYFWSTTGTTFSVFDVFDGATCTGALPS